MSGYKLTVLPYKIDFTKNVENSKVEAEVAKNKIPEIRTMIYEKQTRENRGALYGAQDAARLFKIKLKFIF